MSPLHASKLRFCAVVVLLLSSSCSSETGGGTAGAGGGGGGGGGGGAGGAGPASQCSNGQLDGDESDVDCGGTCGLCAKGSVCQSPQDCEISSCIQNRCVLPGCDNGVKDGYETDADCGGVCPDTVPVCSLCGPCGAGKACKVAADCASGTCTAGACE